MQVGPTPTAPQTFVQIVGACDNFRLPKATDPAAEQLVTWHLTPDHASPAIGLLRPAVVEQLLREIASNKDQTPWSHQIDGSGKTIISFAAHVNTPTARSRVMKELCERWRDEGLWSNTIGPKQWRNEMYPIYRDPFGPHDAPTEAEQFRGAAELESTDSPQGDDRNYAFMMERAASALFGVVTYGVHMSVYEEDIDAEGVPMAHRMWIPTRSSSKPTWPGWLDNSVAGGIPAGFGPFETLVKESMEEASIEENIVRKYARAIGSISYFFRCVDALLEYSMALTGSYRSPLGWLQPEVECV